ncbi:hypothetical protein [Nocardiopsis aegyptia]|uniref:Type VII secretion system-associated protein n=1 Tax=Nocardiopsis aegyptia TaxID=220378 RepID=A0A7Z0ETZ7_9ACTN|nr:hypothetical protein [Nocardiopsis aegyptia]NYJ37902.1 hypothetical protein [Nocardiopsis aegyptia]
MAESTEITFGYMRDFRDNKILPMLKELKKQKKVLDGYVDQGGSDSAVVNGIIAGNSNIFPGAAEFASTVNKNVRAMRDEIDALIDQFEELDSQLDKSTIRFEDAEDDAVLTAYQLAILIDSENAAGVGGASGNPDGDGDDSEDSSDGE